MSELEPLANSVAVMADIDGMTAPMRRLVYEYGYMAVLHFREQGMDARGMKRPLQELRESKQGQWLATNHVTSKTVASIVRAAEMRSAGSCST